MDQDLLTNVRKTDCTRTAELREFAGGSCARRAFALFAMGKQKRITPLMSIRIHGIALLGSASQIEWAESIRHRVNDEFERVAMAFRSVAHRQDARKRLDTEAIIAIFEEKRGEVLGRNRAGYFIPDWQEISDQVRKMIGQHSRYQAIKVEKAAGND